MRVTRYDVSRLGAARKLPGGGAVVPANISRTGVQIYRDAQGKEVREYRPPEEVFAADALASFEAAAVTIGHPSGPVTPGNWRALSHGVVLDAAGREKIDANEYVGAKLSLQTSDVLGRVDTGDLSEVSCGYSCDVVDTPGTTPDGERYDRVQTNIRANHVALLPSGQARAGREARLRLDGNELIGDGPRIGEKVMNKIRFDGIEYDPASEADMLALQKRIDESDKARTDSASEVATLNKKLGAAEATAATEKARADKAEASLGERVADEIDFRDRMRPVLGSDYAFTADRLKTKRDAVAKLDSKVDCSEWNEDRVDGYLEALTNRGEDYTPRNDGTEYKSDRERADAILAEKRKGYTPKGNE